MSVKWVSKVTRDTVIETASQIKIYLTFEFLVFGMEELVDLLGRGPVRVVPNVVVSGTEPVQAVFDLNLLAVVGNHASFCLTFLD